MRKLALLSIVALCVGCGGSGGGGSSSGSWTGTISQLTGMPAPPGGPATLNLQISESGQISGTCTITSRSETGACSGNLTANSFSLVVDYPTSKDWTVYNASGTALSKTEISGAVHIKSEEYPQSRTVYGTLSEIQLNRQ